MDPLTALVDRRLASVVCSRLSEEPVVLIQGPRAVGKSTLLRAIGTATGTAVIDFDDLATREAARRDPSVFAVGGAPVCIDEYQHVPAILDAIKAELNIGVRPGRYMLAGSTRFDSLPEAAQSLTGRLHRTTLWPLSQGELSGVPEAFVETLLQDPRRLVGGPASSTTRAEYVERIIAGGYPLALARSTASARNRWYDDYVSLVLERDVLELSRVRQRAVFPRLLSRLAAQTGQALNIANAARDVDLDPSTAENYTKLLEAVFLIHRVPAWGTTLRSRAVLRPKLHVVDSGLAARLLRLSQPRLESLQPSALTELGHLLETFCVNEVLKQISWLDEPAHVGHWRTHDGAEVDLIIERDDGAVAGLEFKIDGRVQGSSFNALRRLRDLLGDAFLGGVVLHTGSRSYTFDDRLHVAPVDRLWTTNG